MNVLHSISNLYFVTRVVISSCIHYYIYMYFGIRVTATPPCTSLVLRACNLIHGPFTGIPLTSYRFLISGLLSLTKPADTYLCTSIAGSILFRGCCSKPSSTSSSLSSIASSSSHIYSLENGLVMPFAISLFLNFLQTNLIIWNVPKARRFLKAITFQYIFLDQGRVLQRGGGCWRWRRIYRSMMLKNKRRYIKEKNLSYPELLSLFIYSALTFVQFVNWINILIEYGGKIRFIYLTGCSFPCKWF